MRGVGSGPLWRMEEDQFARAPGRINIYTPPATLLPAILSTMCKRGGFLPVNVLLLNGKEINSIVSSFLSNWMSFLCQTGR